MTFVIRAAEEADLPAILAIHNDAIQTSLAIWQTEPVDLENRRAWLRDRQARGHAVLVAERAGERLGFASTGDFRFGSGYGATVEDSIYVARAHRGAGIGKPLLGALVDRARAGGKHVMVAAIGLPNEASVGLHAACGFAPAGTLAEIGRKEGRWLDLLFMQRVL